MSSPKNISISDFIYHLPDDRIAKYPLANRDESKLLVYNSGKFAEDKYINLAEYIPDNSLLIFNNTRVIEARLIFHKITGTTIELFCLEPPGDITTAMLQREKVLWKCLIGGAKKWKDKLLEKKFFYDGKELVLTAEKKENLSDCFLIEFQWNNKDLSFIEIIHAIGILPLPPYLNRNADNADNERYQTIYAKHEGSVAAPTAGLHFTDKLFEKFHKKNIDDAYVTLHVGAGTFKPVKADVMAQHEMHSEVIDVSLQLIEKLLNHKNNIIAVGTTSLRTLESLFRLGVTVMNDNTLMPEELYVAQWDAYEVPCDHITAKQSLTALSSWMITNKLDRVIAKTSIMIAPGYKMKVANGLITNFHQPKSTLLLLVAAIIGDDWKRMYQYAMDNDFRFLSYGDGCYLPIGIST